MRWIRPGGTDRAGDVGRRLRVRVLFGLALHVRDLRSIASHAVAAYPENIRAIRRPLPSRAWPFTGEGVVDLLHVYANPHGSEVRSVRRLVGVLRV